jgi:hypothetical protein
MARPIFNKKTGKLVQSEYKRRKEIFEDQGPFYKVLQRTNDDHLWSCSGGSKDWGTDKDPAFFSTVHSEGSVSLCNHGLHITNDPRAWHADFEDHETFLVQVPWTDPDCAVSEMNNDKVAVSKLVLTRAACPIDLARFGFVKKGTFVDLTSVHLPSGYSEFRVFGKAKYDGDNPAAISVFAGGELDAFGFTTCVTANNNSRVIAERCRVASYENTYVEARNGTYVEVYGGSQIYARSGAVVRVMPVTYAEGANIYAESGATLILGVAANVYTLPDAQVQILNPENAKKNSRVLAVLNENGTFHQFHTLPAEIPENARILL